MKKKLIKKLAEAGYSKNQLDKGNVARIAKVLKRQDLKVFIKDLKTLEAKHTVTVTIPKEEGLTDLRSYFTKIYPGKRIAFNIDSSLLTGIRVEDYDNVYELSLKSFLEQAVKEQKYD